VNELARLAKPGYNVPTTYIHEMEGVYFSVKFQLGEGDVIEFLSIHLVDGEYQETGPQLSAIFEKLFIVHATEGEVESLLSNIAGVIYEHYGIPFRRS
jgi:hypothetical protein